MSKLSIEEINTSRSEDMELLLMNNLSISETRDFNIPKEITHINYSIGARYQEGETSESPLPSNEYLTSLKRFSLVLDRGIDDNNIKGLVFDRGLSGKFKHSSGCPRHKSNCKRPSKISNQMRTLVGIRSNRRIGKKTKKDLVVINEESPHFSLHNSQILSSRRQKDKKIYDEISSYMKRLKM
jgi:hypothetical protein